MKLYLRGALRLLVAAKVAPSSQILVTLMMGAMRSSETSVLTTAARRHIPEDRILNVFCFLAECSAAIFLTLTKLKEAYAISMLSVPHC
jgi:hypothetical protein